MLSPDHNQGLNGILGALLRSGASGDGFHGVAASAQEDDFRTLIDSFVAALPQIEFPTGLNLQPAHSPRAFVGYSASQELAGSHGGRTAKFHWGK